MENNNQIKIKKPSKLSAFFICLFIAICLWLLHALNTVYVKDIKIPVSFRNLPPGKIPPVRLPDSLYLKVKASGLKFLMISLNQEKEPYVVNFSDLQSNTSLTRYYLSSGLKKLSESFQFDLELKSVYPDTIVLASKNTQQKLVPLKPLIDLSLKQGYACSKVTITPSELLIYGSESDLKVIDTLYTTSLMLTDVSDDISRKVSLNIPLSGIYTEISQAQVVLQIEKLIERHLILPILTNKELSNYHYAFFPPSVRLKITAPLSHNNNLDTSQIMVQAQTDMIRDNKMPVKISGLPNGWYLVKQDPEEVEYLKIKK